MKCELGKITKNEQVIDNIYKIEVEFNEDIKPGQFFMLKTLDDSFLLPRPISVHDVKDGIVVFLYRVEGKGTSIISSLLEGNEIQIFGPLGNGFDLEKLTGKIAVIGGGIGIAPLYYLVKSLENVDTYLGFKNQVYCIDAFNNESNNIKISTEDGSFGEKGFITDFININDYDTIITCGPEIMMNKIMKDCNDKEVKVYASLESRMACGIGACLGCTIETKNGNKRVCKDGPVFDGIELITS